MIDASQAQEPILTEADHARDFDEETSERQAITTLYNEKLTLASGAHAEQDSQASGYSLAFNYQKHKLQISKQITIQRQKHLEWITLDKQH